MDTDKIIEKVCCYGQPQNNVLETAALMNGGFGGNQAWNNPMMYFVWMYMMRFMNGYGGEGSEYNSRALSQLQSTVDNNHNNDLAMQAIQGNAGAIRELATNMNTNYNTMAQAICGVKSAIEQVGGQVGYSTERVINAVNLGDAGVTQMLQQCCCQTKTAILEQGYQSQLAIERQTNALGAQIANAHSQDMLLDAQHHADTLTHIEHIASGIQQGFAQITYQNEKNANAIMQNQSQNTQRILDQMCATSTQALRDVLADKDRELQTQTIINQLRNSGCNCN